MSSRIDQLIAGLQEMRTLMRKRRKREKVVSLLSDQFLVWRALSAELAGAADEFSEPPPKVTREEEDRPQVLQGVEHTTPLTALMQSESGLEDDATDETYELVRHLREMEDIEEAAIYLQHRLTDAVRNARLVTVRAMIRHIWQGALNPWQMMKHALAITRAYAQKQLRGITQTELSMLLNETRQATNTRERTLHDQLLERWGVKGYKPDGGLKSETARAAFKRAATGNRNRATAERKRRKQKLLTGGRAAAQRRNETHTETIDPP